MTEKEIRNFFEEINNRKIIVLGDVMVDSYLWGKVERISPEAPIPVVGVTKREYRPGGAANVALNLWNLGAKPVICSVIGDDASGKIFFDLLKSRDMSTEGLIVKKERKTTLKTRVISSNQHLLRIDDENINSLSKPVENELSYRINEILERQIISAIIFQDYDKGAITQGLIESVTEMAVRKNIPVLVDPKKRNFNYYKNIILFKPNFKELTEGLKSDLDKSNFAGIFETVKQLHNRNIEYVMVTLSELGILISHQGMYYRIPSKVRDIADVSGAGDTVISITALCLIAGMEAKNIAAIANIAGGLVCEKAGVVPVDKAQLLEECIIHFANT
ncbi:MAG: D-glycero-beta-D-manno-heptose-7-phosphate kinase [Bacteroidia bacterium]|nr:D-glycero-beta-D-manno-heptose-7-phosphate kinase [Bacteroidia bacterium]